MPQHDLGDVDIRDHTILERTHGYDAFRRPTKHALGFETNAFDSLRAAFNGNDGRFVQDDAFALHVHECVRGTQIDGDVVDWKPLAGADQITKAHRPRNVIGSPNTAT